MQIQMMRGSKSNITPTPNQTFESIQIDLSIVNNIYQSRKLRPLEKVLRSPNSIRRKPVLESLKGLLRKMQSRTLQFVRALRINSELLRMLPIINKIAYLFMYVYMYLCNHYM